MSSFHFDRYDYKHHGEIYYCYDGCDYVWWGKGGGHDLAMHHNGRFDDCFIDHDHCDLDRDCRHDRECKHDRDCKHDYENQKFVWGLAEEAAEVNGRDYLPYNKLYHYNDYELIYYINDVTIDNEEVLVEYGAKGSATGTYEYGNERLSVEYANHAKEYYLYNGTGNVVQTTTQNSSVFLRYTYDAFGNITSIRAPFAVDTDDINRYTFNGEDYDYTTGLQYLRARYYNTSTGSFISQDTYLGQIISPLSQNRYTYCHNNPVMYDDPSGHCVYCETTGIGPCSDMADVNEHGIDFSCYLYKAITIAELKSKDTFCFGPKTESYPNGFVYYDGEIYGIALPDYMYKYYYRDRLTPEMQNLKDFRTVASYTYDNSGVDVWKFVAFIEFEDDCPPEMAGVNLLSGLSGALEESYTNTGIQLELQKNLLGERRAQIYYYSADAYKYIEEYGWYYEIGETSQGVLSARNEYVSVRISTEHLDTYAVCYYSFDEDGYLLASTFWCIEDQIYVFKNGEKERVDLNLYPREPTQEETNKFYQFLNDISYFEEDDQ